MRLSSRSLFSTESLSTLPPTSRVSIFAHLKLHVCFSVFTKFCPRLWVALSPFRRVKENLKLKSFNPIVAAAKTKYSKKIIQFKRSHDISWLIIENDCQGEVCVLRARYRVANAYLTRTIHRGYEDDSGCSERDFIVDFVDVCWNCASVFCSA